MRLPDPRVGAHLHAASVAALGEADINWGEKPDAHEFTRVGEGHYRLDVPEYLAVFDVDRLHRQWNETVGEMVVTCKMAGVKAYNGVIYSGNVNLSAPSRRKDTAQSLQRRANTGND